MYELGVVYRNIRRADSGIAAKLGALGTATVHEAMGRTGLMKPYLRPICAGAAVGGVRRERKLAQVFRGGAGVVAQLLLQLHQPLAEELELCRVHVLRLRHLDDFRLGQNLGFTGH